MSQDWLCLCEVGLGGSAVVMSVDVVTSWPQQNKNVCGGCSLVGCKEQGTRVCYGGNVLLKKTQEQEKNT